jgi:hypothetical protein
MDKFQVVCVDAKNRPKEIPAHLWLESEELYTVKSVQKMENQPGVIGLVLVEIDLPLECPYDSFRSDRFRPATEDDYAAIEAVKALLEEVEEEFLELV